MKIIKRPARAHFWESLDVGFIDRTGWLLGYVWYEEGVLVIEDEFLLSQASTQEIADEISAHEEAAFGKDRIACGHKQPYKRISDIDHRLVADLRQQHSLAFTAIDNKKFSADINLTNVLLGEKRILVSEKCVHLRRQLQTGVYSKTRKDMAKDSLNGHFDLLAALRYGVRLAEPMLRVDPYPTGFRRDPLGPNTTWSDGSGNPQMESLALGPDTEFSRHSRQQEEEQSSEIPDWYVDPR